MAVDGSARRPGTGWLTRVLIALVALLLPVTLLVGWTHREVTDTEGYVATVTT